MINIIKFDNECFKTLKKTYRDIKQKTWNETIRG